MTAWKRLALLVEMHLDPDHSFPCKARPRRTIMADTTSAFCGGSPTNRNENSLATTLLSRCDIFDW
jgi:hypothetical protein